MLYAAAAVERAMKVQEVICRVLAGTLTWLQGADILGIHTRSLRRWRARYEHDGVLDLHGRRRAPPSLADLRECGNLDRPPAVTLAAWTWGSCGLRRCGGDSCHRLG